MKINWLTKLWLKLFPQSFLKMSAKQQGIDTRKLNYAMKLFETCQRIDIQPLFGSSRGFILTLDNSLSLWFFQDGDTFAFDGYEVGPYENGAVTIFDGLSRLDK